MFVFDVISLPFSFPVGDVSDDDDAVTDDILFSCIFLSQILHKTMILNTAEGRQWVEWKGSITIKVYGNSHTNNLALTLCCSIVDETGLVVSVETQWKFS